MDARDLADFVYTIIPKLKELPQNTNVGLGADFSILDYYKAVAQVIGYEGDFVFDLSKPVGMMQKLVDTSFQKSLNWAPSHSLHQGIESAYEFFKRGLDSEI